MEVADCERLATRGAGTHPEHAAKATSQSASASGGPRIPHARTARGALPLASGVVSRLVFAVIGLGLVAIVAIGLTQSRGGDAPPARTISTTEAQERLAGAPPALAALHEQANELLPGGMDAFEARLEELRGHPVVVNGWASWCGPCRAEFPFLQKASVDLGKQVAFLGLDTEDNDGDAAGFLERFPVTYPSYTIPRIPSGTDLGAVRGLPFTAFYDAEGELQYLHQGGYASQEQLDADIRRYAMGADA